MKMFIVSFESTIDNGHVNCGVYDSVEKAKECVKYQIKYHDQKIVHVGAGGIKVNNGIYRIETWNLNEIY